MSVASERHRRPVGVGTHASDGTLDGRVAGGELRLPRVTKRYLRCRILDRIRRFLRPIFRRPFPDFFVPTSCSATDSWEAGLELWRSAPQARPSAARDTAPRCVCSPRARHVPNHRITQFSTTSALATRGWSTDRATRPTRPFSGDLGIRGRFPCRVERQCGGLNRPPSIAATQRGGDSISGLPNRVMCHVAVLGPSTAIGRRSRLRIRGSRATGAGRLRALMAAVSNEGKASIHCPPLRSSVSKNNIIHE